MACSKLEARGHLLHKTGLWQWYTGISVCLSSCNYPSIADTLLQPLHSQYLFFNLLLLGLNSRSNHCVFTLNRLSRLRLRRYRFYLPGKRRTWEYQSDLLIICLKRHKILEKIIKKMVLKILLVTLSISSLVSCLPQRGSDDTPLCSEYPGYR